MQTQRIFFLLMLFTVITIAACKPERSNLVEPKKKIANTWVVTKVMRNEDNLTQWVDLTKFKLVLNADDSYSLTNTVLPFLVTENGTWSVDDVQYPTKLTLKSSTGVSNAADIALPVAYAKRSIIITFSPGCTANKYEYTLQSMN